MKKTRKILSMILCSAMLVTVAPQTAFAEGEETGEQTGYQENTVETQAIKIVDWQFADNPDGLSVYEKDGKYAADVPQGNIPLNELASMLPGSLTAKTEGAEEVPVEVSAWNCPEYVADGQGAWPQEGEYTFTAEIQEGYEIDETPAVTVRFADAVEPLADEEYTETTEGNVITRKFHTFPDGFKIYSISIEAGKSLILDFSEAVENPKASVDVQIYPSEPGTDITIKGAPGKSFPIDFIIQDYPDYPSVDLTLENFSTGLTGTKVGRVQLHGSGTSTLRYQGSCEIYQIDLSNKADEHVLNVSAKDASSSLKLRYVNASGCHINITGGTYEVEENLSASDLSIEDSTITFKETSNMERRIQAGSTRISGSALYNVGRISPADEFDENSFDGSLIDIDDSTIEFNPKFDSHYSWTPALGNAETITIDDSVISGIETMRDYGGIGGCFETLDITKSKVYAKAEDAPAIGPNEEAVDENISGSKITICDSYIEAASDKGAAIGMPYLEKEKEKPENLEELSVTISGDSDVTATSIQSAAIGGGRWGTTTIKDDGKIELVIGSGIGNWGAGTSVSDEDAGLHSLRAARSMAPRITGEELQAAFAEEMQLTDNVNITVEGKPAISAKSGVLAIYGKTVACKDTNLVQNTMVTQTGSSQTLYKAESPGAVTVGDESIGELGYGYASVAATNLSAQTGADMKFGNSVLTDVTSGSDQFNVGSTGWQYFFTSPLLEIYGTVQLVNNEDGNPVTGSAVVGTALKAGLTGLAPASVQNDSNDKVAYQWYRDGEEISGEIGASYSLTQDDENTVVYCVVSGIGSYTGAVTSNAVTVTDNAGQVPAPELDSRTEDSITLKEIVGYEYKIVNGPKENEDWQPSPEFTGLTKGQTYTFIQKDQNGRISPAASFTTLSDAPQTDEFAFDYVNEKLKFQSGIYIYENENCEGEALNQNSGSLSIDISKYIADSDTDPQILYAKYQDGNAVTEIKIPNRPSLKPLQGSDVTASAGSISFQGEKGVSYQLQDGNGYQAGPQKLGEGNTITYSGLIPGATYTLKMRIEASNAQPDPHFHSDQYDLQITLSLATDMSGTVLLPAGSTDAVRSYDLSRWLEDAEISTVEETLDADGMISSFTYTGTILTVTGGSADADKEATLVVTAGSKKLTLTVRTVNVLAEEAEDDILWVRPFYPDAGYIDGGKTEEELDEQLDEKAEADGYDPKEMESFVLVPLHAVGADVAASRDEIEIHFTPTEITELERKVVALYMIPKTGDDLQQIPVEKNPGGGVDFTISGQGGYLRLYCEDGYRPEITIESIAVNGETTDTPVAGLEDQVSVTMKVASEKEDVPLVGTPTGTVTLYNGKPGTDEPLATGTLEDGSATLEFTVDVEDLLAGKIDLYAVYEGDNNYVSVNTADATVISVEESVPAAPAVTAVTADGNPYTSGTWTKQDHVVFTVSGSSAESGIAGYEYSADGGKKWTGITPDAEGAYCLTVPDEGQTTYLFRVVTNAGTEGKASEAFGVKIDRTAPAAAIHVKDNQWTGFLNTITFGKFFKKTADVKITASDAAQASGVEKVEYMLSTDAFASADQADGDWTELTGTSDGAYSFRIEPNQKGSVYVRVTDHAGNMTVINSEGIVVYTDAAQQTQDISFTKLSKDDVSFAVSLNGNTVKSLTLESEDAQGQTSSAAIPDADYSVSDDGVITLTPSYLQTLAAGSYTVRVDYNPMGETYVDSADNDAPAVTTVALTVARAAGTVTIDGDTGKTYDGQPAAPAYTADNTDGDVVIEYKAKGADDAAYTTEAPENAGDYTVRVTVKEDAAGNYTEASVTQDFTIEKKELTVSLKIQDKQYDGLHTAAYAEGPALVGVVSGDNVELTGGTPTFDSVKTGEDIAVSFTDFAISGDSAGNYTLTQPSGVTAEIYNTYEAEPGTDYTVNTNDNGWVKEGFVIAAKEGYSLSLTDTADGTWTDTLSASDETDSGEVTFYVKNETTGAISLAKTEDYKIDRTAPVIEGIADGGIYCVSAEFTVSDRNIDKVQINGEDAAAKDGVYTLAAGEYTVTALDKAGNAAEMKVTVREAHDFIWVTDKEPTETEAGLKHEACTVCGYAKDPVEIPAAGQEKPAEPAEPGKPAGDQAGGTGAVQTGDPADSMLWILLMLAAGAAAAGAELYRRKRR